MTFFISANNSTESSSRLEMVCTFIGKTCILATIKLESLPTGITSIRYRLLCIQWQMHCKFQKLIEFLTIVFDEVAIDLWSKAYQWLGLLSVFSISFMSLSQGACCSVLGTCKSLLQVHDNWWWKPKWIIEASNKTDNLNSSLWELMWLQLLRLWTAEMPTDQIGYSSRHLAS